MTDFKVLGEGATENDCTEIQEVAASPVAPLEPTAKALSVMRRKWYDSLQFPQNQWDFARGEPRFHGLYLVTCGPFAKIGIAWNPAKRFGSLLSGAPWDMRMEVAYWVPYPTSRLAEAYCHAALEQFWSRGEWFEVDTRIAKRVIEAVAWRACKSRREPIQKVRFAHAEWPTMKRPTTARLLRAIPDYQDPPPHPTPAPPPLLENE